ncbi:MAG: site-specific DNA-methyltransferase [Hyphomonadaceae bacterium]|nr:site-specific DNA-methyltransferase [Hyphomonadaceae bacterium]MBC6411713.1 site-specific DNA-methyltransferase [Hyphomonadaceae bacterium]
MTGQTMIKDTGPKSIAVTSRDLRGERLAALKQLFPDLFDGEGQLDDKALRALVSDGDETGPERFRFEWAGKWQSKRFAFAPSRATLNYDASRSLNRDGTPAKSNLRDNTSGNLIIEADNLEALKLLSSSYFERVNCIYIDPPYNTGNDFIYPDDYSETRKAYWQKSGAVKDGVRLSAVTEASGRRHSKWLNFMQSRLLLARQLLRSDGVIFVSIDDNEVHNLRKLMDEVFGEENFVLNVIWKKRTGSNDAQNNVSIDHDYVLCYSKSEVLLNGLSKEFDNYKNPDNDPMGVWTAGDLTCNKTASERPNLFYPITDPKTDIEYPCNPNRVWVYEPERMARTISEGKVIFPKKASGTPMYKRHLSEVKSDKKPFSSMLETEMNFIATKRLRELLDGQYFDYPKGIPLVVSLIEQSLADNDIFLDFFAGSGTSAHAVMQKNAEDGGNRKYILVQIPEYTGEKSEARKAGYETISDICIERVRRAGAKIREENPDADIDTGFRVFRLADSHFPQNLFRPNPDESGDLPAFEAHLKTASQGDLYDAETHADVVTEIALKNGFGLFYTLDRLDAFTDNAVYRLSGHDKSALLCLDGSLHNNTVEALKPHGDEQLIVRKHAHDTARKFDLHTAFMNNLWTV